MMQSSSHDARAIERVLRVAPDLRKSVRLVGSPIEALFLIHGVVSLGWSVCACTPDVFCLCAGLRRAGMAQEAIFHHADGLMALQPPMDFGARRVRLDFAFVSDRFHRVAVELDGHDFHERTKEQAARDRSRDRLLTIDGWTVLRFTGSEVDRDVARCWSEVLSVLRTEGRPR